MKRILITILALLPVAARADSTPADKLQEALADLVNKSVQVAGDAKNFLAEQLPDVIKQLLMWKMAESIADCVIAVFAVMLLVVGLRWYIHLARKHEWDFTDDLFPASLFGGVAAVLLSCVACSCFNLAWLQIWLAPKVYLIEYASNALRK